MPSNQDGTTKQGDIHTFQRPCSGLKNWQRRGKKWFAISSVADWKLLTWLWWFSSAPTWLPYWQLTWLLWPVWPKRFRVRHGSSTTVSSARLGQSTQCYPATIMSPLFSWQQCLAIACSPVLQGGSEPPEMQKIHLGVRGDAPPNHPTSTDMLAYFVSPQATRAGIVHAGYSWPHDWRGPVTGPVQRNGSTPTSLTCGCPPCVLDSHLRRCCTHIATSIS